MLPLLHGQKFAENFNTKHFSVLLFPSSPRPLQARESREPSNDQPGINEL